MEGRAARPRSSWGRNAIPSAVVALGDELVKQTQGPGIPRAAPISSPAPDLATTPWQKHAFPITTELGYRRGLGLVSQKARHVPNEA